MAEAVPQKIDFEIAKEYDKRRTECKTLIMVISIVAAIYGVIPFQSIKIEIVMSIALLLVSLLSIYYSSRYDETFRKAEKTRRDGFLDNTFNTRLADIPSSGYYDTDSIEYGIKKLMSNLHESCIYTCKITNQMFVKAEKKLICWCCLIIVLALINFFGTLFVISVIDVFVSIEVMEEYLELKRLHAETEAIQQECKKIAENAESKEWEEDSVLVSEILQVLLQYETALSYASIILDTDIYNELNPTIAKEWASIKKRYYE